MKKVLFATTALVASAGIASAQGVALSGAAEMGIVGGDGIETQFWHDIDVKFALSGETDNGLTFGATIDLDELNGDGINPTGGGNCFIPTVGLTANALARGQGHCPGENDASVFISGNFGTLTMGDTDGAFDWAMQEIDAIGDIADVSTGHAGFNGNGGLDGAYDGQVVRYDYTFGDFSFAVSAEIDDAGVGDAVFGIGGKYSGDLGGVMIGVGIGYQTANNVDVVGVSLDAKMDNGLRGIFNYSTIDAGGATADHIGIGLFYDINALSLGVNYGEFSGGGASVSGIGFAANYDLGGGAVVKFGYGYSDLGAGVSADAFSLGIAMSF